ncbi:MAG: hypothetical protein EXR74_09745 [Bdellovibrionales bacterium]|nr:hypothetical protein [Bdellovibrionales bacterium]
MNQSVQLKIAKLPRMVGELVHSNQFLKVFSVSALVVTLLTVLVLLLTVQRPPVILTLAATGENLEHTDTPNAENQIRAAVGRYLELRYKWTPQDVKQKLASARAFVLAKNLKAFDTAVENIAKFSTDRAASQHIYPEKIDVSLEKSTVSITGDRVTSVQGLKAVGELRLELTFQSGARSKLNPWGLYITKEREE